MGKEKNNVAIIGGADGPTSIFVAGESDKKPLKIRIEERMYGYRRGRAEKKITANVHTLEEVAAYAKDKYGIEEIDESRIEYQEEYGNLKESLIIRKKPELIADMKEICKPDINDEKSIKDFLSEMQERSEAIRKIPDNQIRMDFHLYTIYSEQGSLKMEIDYIWNDFGISYSGNKKDMKRFKKIAKDLYQYYGVDEQDIRNKTDRYKALLAVLSQR